MEAQVARVIIQVIFYSGILAPMAMSWFWPWWRSELGWSIVAKTLALSMALLPAMLVYWFGLNTITSSPALRWFSLTALAAVPVIVWWRVWVIFKAQRDGSRNV